jgi:hypothetical protein
MWNRLICFCLGHKMELTRHTHGVGFYECMFCGKAYFAPLAIARQHAEIEKYGRLQ